jgi:hypothetical protein
LGDGSAPEIVAGDAVVILVVGLVCRVLSSLFDPVQQCARRAIDKRVVGSEVVLLAVDARPAVLMAASPEIDIETDTAETTETEQDQAVADGGQVIVDDADDGECVCDSSLTDLSCFEHFTLDDESTEGDR